MLIELFSSCSVIRASVPKMNLDDAFEQKNEIAKAVEDELEKVCVHHFVALLELYFFANPFILYIGNVNVWI